MPMRLMGNVANRSMISVKCKPLLCLSSPIAIELPYCQIDSFGLTRPLFDFNGLTFVANRRVEIARFGNGSSECLDWTGFFPVTELACALGVGCSLLTISKSRIGANCTN